MKNKILKIAKMLKTFTFEDLIVMSDIDEEKINQIIPELLTDGIITKSGKYYEYAGNKNSDSIKIADKNIKCKNIDITVIEACEEFLKNCKSKKLKINTVKAYKSFINSYIVPYFKTFKLKTVSISDISDFKNYMQRHKISDRRIRNILVLFNQIIKYYQNQGFIDKTCVFEVRRLEKIPKREIQILTQTQVVQLFTILEKDFPYLISVVRQVITLKQPLNTVLTGNEQEKNRMKRKIRKDFYKVK